MKIENGLRIIGNDGLYLKKYLSFRLNLDNSLVFDVLLMFIFLITLLIY